jgi:hypothetical protein
VQQRVATSPVVRAPLSVKRTAAHAKECLATATSLGYPQSHPERLESQSGHLSRRRRCTLEPYDNPATWTTRRYWYGSGVTDIDSGAESRAVPVDLNRACTPKWSASSSRL